MQLDEMSNECEQKQTNRGGENCPWWLFFLARFLRFFLGEQRSSVFDFFFLSGDKKIGKFFKNIELEPAFLRLLLA